MREPGFLRVLPAPLSHASRQGGPDLESKSATQGRELESTQSELCLRAAVLKRKGILFSGAVSLNACSPGEALMCRLRRSILGLRGKEEARRFMGKRREGKSPSWRHTGQWEIYGGLCLDKEHPRNQPPSTAPNWGPCGPTVKFPLRLCPCRKLPALL